MLFQKVLDKRNQCYKGTLLGQTDLIWKKKTATYFICLWSKCFTPFELCILSQITEFRNLSRFTYSDHYSIIIITVIHQSTQICLKYISAWQINSPWYQSHFYETHIYFNDKFLLSYSLICEIEVSKCFLQYIVSHHV